MTVGAQHPELLGDPTDEGQGRSMGTSIEGGRGGTGADRTGGADDPVHDLRMVVAAQAAMIEELQQRLERLEGAGPLPTSEARAEIVDPPARSLHIVSASTPTSRRQLMTRGAAVAAGAAVAGSVLSVATATPAAAAQGVFTGNPAVVGTTVPDNSTAFGVSGSTVAGIGVVGSSDSNAGIWGNSKSHIGVWGNCDPGSGVYGSSKTGNGVLGSSNSAVGVLGTSGTSAGVQGITGGATATAVVGTSNSRTGENTGVGGLTNSPDGYGVKGNAQSLTGKSVGTYGVAISDQGSGVVGEAPSVTGETTGTAGLAYSPDGFGVKGFNSATTGEAKGTFGLSMSPDGMGVYGSNLAQGIGVFGVGGLGLVGLSPKAQLKLAGGPPSPLGSTQARTAGEIVFDNAQDMWVCVAPGSPGTWRRISGPTTAGALVVLPATKRIYDSRAGTNPATVQKGIFANAEERTIDATLGSGVPAGATAVLLNCTATNTNPGGFFAFFKNGIAWPQNSSLSWGSPGSTIANLAVVAVDGAAKFRARCQGAGGADLVVDCIGYFQ